MWTFRLGYFLMVTRIMPGKRDPRMETIFDKFPPHTFQRDIAVLLQYLFQGMIVLVTSSSLYWMFKNQLSWDASSWNFSQMKDFHTFNYMALFLGLMGIIFEGVAGSLYNNTIIAR